MASTATRFVNKTTHMVKMQVGSSQYCSVLASIEEGGEYKLHVNVNDTYREFTVAVGSEPGCRKMIVTSDDCCDFQCITIEEVDGKIELLRQPRESQPTVGSTPASKKPWFSWGMWMV
ncbi:hypothetical protein KC19_10G035900 [Ceratodon purpureus]|uniref:DUF7748 domain-containing protein n=1 Tax=Ceratodon purpureus TaxID=3225 RepID=A0A8T0GGS8_CERPU|nr:hypothetical protein KC19_10G035900 [Ceratodon purpureus]